MVSRGYYEGKTDISLINKKNNRKIELIFLPDFEKESLDIVKKWETQQIYYFDKPRKSSIIILTLFIRLDMASPTINFYSRVKRIKANQP